MTKSIDNAQTLKAIAEHRSGKQRVVFTNGCFDVLHVGHLRYLQAARALGEVLVVGINSDDSVRRLKGPERPIVPEDDRRELLLGLKPVDYVCTFSDDTPLALIQQVQPDILVKGGDWPIEKIVGSDFVQSYGGDVRSLAFYEGFSTTNIIERIRASCGAD